MQTVTQDRVIHTYTETQWGAAHMDAFVATALQAARDYGRRFATIVVEPDELLSDMERKLVINLDRLQSYAHKGAEREVDRFKKLTDADAVYAERNMLVALLARAHPSGVVKNVFTDDGVVWHCVYIDIPKIGQVSWHYSDNESALFAGLMEYVGEYDGHTTINKYFRIVKGTLMHDALSNG